MIFTRNKSSEKINTLEILNNFESCINNFIDVMDQENKCIQEHDTFSLTRLVPLKQECSARYEKVVTEIDAIFDSKIFTKEDLIKISAINKIFSEKSKENYSYLESSHDFSHRLMNIFFKSINEINKYSYTNRGESIFVNSTKPVALSQNV